MSDQREQGYYWVRLRDGNEWCIAEWFPEEGYQCWFAEGMEQSFSDDLLAEIGPRVPTREELQTMRDKLAQYVQRFGHLD